MQSRKRVKSRRCMPGCYYDRVGRRDGGPPRFSQQNTGGGVIVRHDFYTASVKSGYLLLL